MNVAFGIPFSIVLMLLLLLVQGQTEAAESELRLKAAFLYKFCSYIQWPESAFAGAGSPIRIGILEHDNLADELTRMVIGRDVHQRSLVVRPLAQGDDLAEFHMVYLSNVQSSRAVELLNAGRQGPVVVVTDAASLPDAAIINFILRENRIRFEISHTRAKALGIGLSSQLLAIAVKVE